MFAKVSIMYIFMLVLWLAKSLNHVTASRENIASQTGQLVSILKIHSIHYRVPHETEKVWAYARLPVSPIRWSGAGIPATAWTLFKVAFSGSDSLSLSLSLSLWPRIDKKPASQAAPCPWSSVSRPVWLFPDPPGVACRSPSLPPVTHPARNIGLRGAHHILDTNNVVPPPFFQVRTQHSKGPVKLIMFQVYLLPPKLI